LPFTSIWWFPQYVVSGGSGQAVIRKKNKKKNKEGRLPGEVFFFKQNSYSDH
jgi:hypothetical protein